MARGKGNFIWKRLVISFDGSVFHTLTALTVIGFGVRMSFGIVHVLAHTGR